MNNWVKEKKDLSNIRLKFRSGNEIPVPEARVTREEWESVERLLTEANELLGLVRCEIMDTREGELNRVQGGLLNHSSGKPDRDRYLLPPPKFKRLI